MSDGRRIIVAGGGIGGVEAALTLAVGLPDADVVLLDRSGELRILPEIVYMPFGVRAAEITVPLERLEEHGVTVQRTEVRRVDAPTRQVLTTEGPLSYDVLVAAPGARSNVSPETSIRSVDDARRVREELAALVAEARNGTRRDVTIDVGSEDSWSAPAAEFAVLLGTWLEAQGVAEHVEVLFATEDREAFEWFGPRASDLVTEAMARHGIKIATGIPAGHGASLGGDMTISFGGLEARNIDGLPGRGPDGWYVTDDHNAVAEHVYVIGDATTLPYRSAFATAWESRRVLTALGGNVATLGEQINGVPSTSVEYQMDLGEGTMRTRVGRADMLAHPFLGHDGDVEFLPGVLPHKLAGLLIGELLIPEHDPALNAPQGFRELLAAARADRS